MRSYSDARGVVGASRHLDDHSCFRDRRQPPPQMSVAGNGSSHRIQSRAGSVHQLGTTGLCDAVPVMTRCLPERYISHLMLLIRGYDLALLRSAGNQELWDIPQLMTDFVPGFVCIWKGFAAGLRRSNAGHFYSHGGRFLPRSSQPSSRNPCSSITKGFVTPGMILDLGSSESRSPSSELRA